MAGKSLPPVSAKVIADIEQFVSEFKRAENVARRTSDNIGREMGELAKKTAKKFELGDVGKDILKGAGLFGGFAIAQTAADAISGRFREAAEAAKEMEASSARSLDHVRKAIASKQTDPQQLETAKKQRDEIVRTLAELNKIETVTRKIRGNRDDREVRTIVDTIAPSNEKLEQIRKSTHELEAIAEVIAGLEKKISSSRETASEKESTSRTRSLTEQLRAQEQAFNQLLTTQQRANNETKDLREEANKLAEKYREMADPTLRFKNELAEINALMSDGKLKAHDAARAIEAVNRAMADDERARVSKSLNDFFGEMDARSKETAKVSDAAREMGFAFSSAFEDAIIDGQKLGDVLGGLIKDIARMGLRLAVTNPILNAVFGTTAGWTPLATMFGGARASGGPVSGGKSYLVGEQGPELFVPGSSGGIVPNHAMGGGGTYYIDARGADRSGLARLESMIASINGSIESRAMAAVSGAASRGGGYRRAFA